MQSPGDIKAIPERAKGFQYSDEGHASLQLLIRYVYGTKHVIQVQVENKLEKMGIKTLRALLFPLFARKMHSTLKAWTERAGEKSFKAETLLAMRRCVFFEDDCFKDFLHWAVPKWRAGELESVKEKLLTINVHNVQTLHIVLDRGADINAGLSVFSMTAFKRGTLDALRTRAKRVADFCQIKVNLLTMAGRLLATLGVEPSTTGRDLIIAAIPYLEPGAQVRNTVIGDKLIGRNQTIGELNVETGASLQLVLGGEFDNCCCAACSGGQNNR